MLLEETLIGAYDALKDRARLHVTPKEGESAHEALRIRAGGVHNVLDAPLAINVLAGQRVRLLKHASAHRALQLRPQSLKLLRQRERRGRRGP
jgi:hypothetical protein